MTGGKTESGVDGGQRALKRKKLRETLNPETGGISVCSVALKQNFHFVLTLAASVEKSSSFVSSRGEYDPLLSDALVYVGHI